MPPRTSPVTSRNQENGSSNWVNTSINGGVMILSCVNDAAKITSVPHLAGAAGLTLTIVEAVRQVKNNKKDFQRLADDASSRIVAIYGAYQKSPNQKAWPPMELKQPIMLLVSTLEEILNLVNQNIAKNKNVFRGFLDNKDDIGKVKELREKLQSASEQFQLSSNLSSNDCLDLVLKQQEQIMAKLEITPSPQEAIHILGSKLNANIEARGAEEEQKQNIAIQKEECEQLNETVSSGSKAVADVGGSSSKLATEQSSGISPQNQPLNARVDAQSDGEENGQTVISVSSSETSGSTDEDERESRRKAKQRARDKNTSNNKRKVMKRPETPPQTLYPSPEPQQEATPSTQPSAEELLSAYFASLGFNPSTGQPYASPPSQPPYNTSYKPAPPSQTPYSFSPSQNVPYGAPPQQDYSNPPNGSYFTQTYPNHPPTMPYYSTPSQSPPPWINPYGGQTNSPFSPHIWASPGSVNTNVGNVIGSTIKNVANDNRTIYKGAPRRRRTRRDDQE